MDIRNWEFYDSGLALVGATVNVRDAILAHPNTTTILATTTTDINGAWAFTGLTDTAKDVEVIWGNVGQYHKWYKGLTRHDTGVIFFEEPVEFKQVASLGTAAGAGSSILAFKTDGEPIFRSGAAGAETKIATFTGATGVLKAGGWGTIGSAEITDDSIINTDVNSGAAIALTKIAHVGAGNVLRSSGGVNVGGQIVSGDITDGTIATADLAANAVTNILLTYNAGTLHNGAAITGSTLFTFLADQSFTVGQSNSIVEIVIRGGGQVSLSSVGVAGSRMYIDSAGANTLYKLGGQRVMVAGEFANPFTGAGSTFITGLSAGAHTVNFKLYAEASGLVYMRGSDFEFFHFQVIEHLR